MKKHLFLKSLLIAIGLLIMSVTQMWGQSFGAENQRQAQMQSQMMMSSGSSYTGTVYQPFSNTTPSEANNPTRLGPRREKIDTGDEGEGGEGGEGWIDKPDYGGTDLSPIGEPWIMALFALAFAGVIALRQYKRKTVKSMNMKNSTSKFIATLALLCTFGVGQMWAHDWKNNLWTVWDSGDRGWTSSYFYIWKDGSSNSGRQTMTRLGTSGQFYQGGFEWNGYVGVQFSNVSSGGGEYTTDINTYANGRLFVSMGTWNNGKLNWQVIDNPKKGTKGKTIYFDDTYSNWTSGHMYLKYGVTYDGGGYNRKIPFSATKVPGTANLYKLNASVADGNGQGATDANGKLDHDIYYQKWFVSKEEGWTVQNTIDDSHVIARTDVYTSDIDDDYTLIPTANTSGTGGSTDPYLWTTTKFAGHTRNVSITSPSHGTIRVDYTNESNSSDNFTSGDRDLAHTCIITVTATPSTGYVLSSLTRNGGAYEEGSEYTIREDNTFAATFTAKQSAITFDYQTSAAGYNDGANGITNEGLKGTYDAEMTTLTGSMPTAKNGYKFMGFYDATGGSGTKYYNADGTSAHVWDKDTESGTTLYAYYQPAEMSLALATLTIGTGEGDSATVSITPAVGSPAFNQVGTIMFCYDVKIKNGASMDPQPVGRQFTEGGVLKYRFASPRYSGNYTLNIKLRAGSDCSGAQVDSKDIDFNVSGDHTVTIRHKCGDVEIHTPTTVTVHPGENADAAGFEDADVFGYHFSTWTIGGTSGVTKERGETSDREITISAIYDGTITANYTKRNLIFFKDNLGWGQVHVNLLKNMKWGYQGTGNDGESCYSANESMTLVPGTTDIYYYEYTSISPYVSFTKQSYPSYTGFSESDTSNPALVVYPTRPNATVDNENYYDNQYYGFTSSTPMFVPLATQTGQNYNGDRARYFNKGYWTNYIGSETGYTLEVYNEDGSTLRQSKPFTSADNLMEMTTSMDLEAGKTYKFQLKRGSIVCGNGGTMTALDCGKTLGWAFVPEGSKCGLITTVAGIYDFKLSFSANGSECELRIAVTYPAAAGDYRLKYKDDDHDVWHPSDVVSNVHESNPIVSFFVRTGSKNQSLQVESCSVDEETGDVSWNTYGAAINPASTYSSIIKENGVYDFYMTINESGALTIDSVKPYTGSYYIRTDVAGSTKWSDFRASDHLMTYTEYADNKNEFTHYYMHWCPKNTNVKFCIANDYSSCISDTLAKAVSEVVSNMDAGGKFSENDSANVRFMWNMHDNSLSRAYLAGAQNDGSYFLVLQGQAGYIADKNGTALQLSKNSGEAGYNHKVANDAIQFSDNQDWIYEAEVQATPGGRIKLYAKYGSTYQYFYGDSDSSFDETHGVELIDGSGGAENIRAIYDFKTNRLLAAWVPRDTIKNNKTIEADIMLVREGQGGGGQINLTNSATLTTSTDKRIYGVMRFNRWDLNNLSREAGHAALSWSQQKTSYERFNYFISFPFDVKVGEIFGFGRIGRHYRIYFYDGIGRAQEGFFAERKSNWKMIDDTDSILHAYQGYFLQLNSLRMATDQTDVWPQAEQSEVELYFPAMRAISSITIANETIPALALDGPYKCNKDLSSLHGGNQDANRTNKDSYWRCIGTPSFANYDADFEEWTGFHYQINSEDVPYLYQWETTTNKLIPVTSNNFEFLSMHAYLIQNPNEIVWTSVSKPTYSAVVARTRDAEAEREWKLTLTNNNEELLDQAFVRMSDNEAVTANFDFGQDLVKEWNEDANIYTFIESEQVAANSMPFSDQTTIVPVGVKIAIDGDYTFAIPEGTYGVGVVLIDNIAGTRTNLALTDYIVYLTAGTHDERFILEISPMAQTPTDIESVAGEGSEISGARKVMVDGVLYIVKDGKVFDARGTLCK